MVELKDNQQEVKHRIKRFVRKAFSYALTLITILSFAYSFYEKKPSLLFHLTNEVNVFDMHKSIDDFEVIFKGQNINKEGKNLKIFTLRIENSGGINITQDLYDKNSEWGVLVEEGSFIDGVRVIDSNSENLRNNLKPKIEEKSIVLNKVILDKKDYVTLEFLVLHKKDIQPKIIPFGKIAGIKSLEISNSVENGNGFIQRFFAGSLWMNISRVIVFGIFFVLLLIVIVYFLIKLSEFVKKRVKTKRKIILSKFSKNRTVNKESMSLIAGIYERYGMSGIKNIKEIMQNRSEFKEMIGKINQRKAGVTMRFHKDLVDDWIYTSNLLERDAILEKMVYANIIFEKSGNIKADRNFAELFYMFHSYLKDKKYKFEIK